MNDMIFGLEVTVIGFIITMATLFILAGILLVFTKAFSGKENGKGRVTKTVTREVEEQKRPAAKTRVDTNMGPDVKILRPEIVAAAIGAINYTLDKKTPAFSTIAAIPRKDARGDFWAQAGRTRLVSLRQDFVSYKRGKLR